MRVSLISLAPKEKSRSSLFVEKDGQKFLLATLDERNPSISVDLYFLKNENVKFYAEGQGTFHLVGYCEPSEFQSQTNAQKAVVNEQKMEVEDEEEDDDFVPNEEEDLD